MLDRELSRALAHYSQRPDDASALLASTDPGEMFTAADDVHERAKKAAATLVASMILNLDEAITHE